MKWSRGDNEAACKNMQTWRHSLSSEIVNLFLHPVMSNYLNVLKTFYKSSVVEWFFIVITAKPFYLFVCPSSSECHVPPRSMEVLLFMWWSVSHSWLLTPKQWVACVSRGIITNRIADLQTNISILNTEQQTQQRSRALTSNMHNVTVCTSNTVLQLCSKVSRI